MGHRPLQRKFYKTGRQGTGPRGFRKFVEVVRSVYARQCCSRGGGGKREKKKEGGKAEKQKTDKQKSREDERN